jgi:hypothetical protein
LVTYKLHILVVNTKICGVPNLIEKALHLAWLTNVSEWHEKMVGKAMVGNGLL